MSIAVNDSRIDVARPTRGSINVDLVEFLQDFGLPFGIAALGFFATIVTNRVQIRDRALERRVGQQEREHDRQLAAAVREADLNGTATTIRANVLESIAKSFSDYAVHSRENGRSLFPVRYELLKLSTRCDAGHLSRRCTEYVEDAAMLAEDSELLSVFEDIQRRLEGWHLDHMTLVQLEAHIAAGHLEVKQHLISHGIQPSTPFYD